MVDGARKLIDKLTQLGFPRENIITLFDKEATSTQIDNVLKDFWEGAQHQDADRLLFYFAGHGDRLAGTSERPRGILITSDYRKSQPTRTSFLLDDLVNRHFEYIKAKHVLVLLDACSSGLALARFQTKSDDEESLSRFYKLSTLRAETSIRSRNILVAGTTDEPALWDQGGVFTKALLRALDGAGDWNQDGLIQFGELALQVRREVSAQAGRRGVKQRPDDFSIGGSFVFIRPQ
jgi:uncharacterized caspase-like protein